MLWKIIALGLGWRLARDDQEGLYVVYLPRRREHFSGEAAWRKAVLHSIRLLRAGRNKAPRP